MLREPTRYLSTADRAAFKPVHAVWEITLACDLKCQHCGSRAGKRRPDELSTDECLDLVRQLARLGTREVTLIGGEAYLRRDWLQIIREVRNQGMDCSMQSGALHLTEERIREAAEAGLQAAGVSIDGLPEVHDQIRGVKGSFDAAYRALQLIGQHGLTPSVNTQISSLVIPQLRELMQLFISAGAKNWQVQLTVAMGNAADNPHLLLQPFELLTVMPLLAELYTEGLEHGLLMQPGNNIGYFGPYESLWRGNGDDQVHFSGCNAGQNTMGIEADGTIKGCPSLPTTPYAGGNIRDLTLEQIWQTTDPLSFTRARSIDDLWGYCRSCYYADVCKAGCTWTTHVLFGKPGNNPYCHHRVLELSSQGLRERVVQVEAAPGRPFDHGRFELIQEPLNEAIVSDSADAKVAQAIPISSISGATRLVQITTQRRTHPRSSTKRTAAATVEPLVVCRGCRRYLKAHEVTCPFCGGDVKALSAAYQKRLRAGQRAYRRLLNLLPAN
ncbi:MAG TPA: GDL motif peptide-associated radical SAM/SPASM maturase [Pyrinomonadaceae bacterium]|nr:GDL motif peptide-associated radical SAM/SPASM maturase [Pyrinomonadaceae bacterium]